MMAKPRRKTSSAKREGGGVAAKMSGEEWRKVSSLSLEKPDDASSSVADPTANRASEGQPEGPAEEILFGTVNDPKLTGKSNEALDPEAVESVLSTNGVFVGDHFCPFSYGCQKKEEATVKWLEPVNVTEEEIKSEQPGCWDKMLKAFKKQTNGFQTSNSPKAILEFFLRLLVVREAFSIFRITKRREIIDEELKDKVLKHPEASSEKIDTVIQKFGYIKTLRLMFFQKANITLKSRFSDGDWCKLHRFPKLDNASTDDQWWEENFLLEKLESRLKIFRWAAKEWHPELELATLIELVADMNSILHPEPSEHEFIESDKLQRLEYEGIDVRRTVCYLLSDGKSEGISTPTALGNTVPERVGLLQSCYPTLTEEASPCPQLLGNGMDWKSTLRGKRRSCHRNQGECIKE